MCGFAGHVGRAQLEPDRVRRTLDAMRHRGPDDQSHRAWVTPEGAHVDFLHSRLSIIDLDPRSNQPFQVGSRWMAYNGELYNYVEVRDSLIARGDSFVTASDTEVLLHALTRNGWDALDDCEGMWAFAVYDEHTGRVGLARDRFGEKPLYLYEDDSGIYWGSEVKFIAEMRGRPLRPNREHLRRFIVNGYKALYKTDQTFFEGVTELPPGTSLDIAADGRVATPRPYWVPPRPQEREMSYDEAVAGTRERLIRSVELRLRADVPLAFCMSGGIDSMSLISIARNVFDYDVHGFTIVNEDERYDEWDMVEHARDQLGIRHTPIPTDTSAFLPRLRELIRGHDAPIYTITYFAHWLLMESIAEQGYRIAISGTAADEMFTGYYDHHLMYLREVAGDPQLHAQAVANWREHVAPVVRNPFLQNADYFVEDPSRRDHIYLDRDEFAATLTQPFDEDFVERDLADGLLRNRMLNELFAESVPVILHEDDLNAMFFSIENRSPFLDRELFEFSTTIPARHLVQRGMAKAVLRDAMRGIVPDKILDNRRKVGFNAPILDFLDVADPEVRGYLLDDSPIFDLIRRDAVERVLGLDFLPNSKSKFLFNFLGSKMFLEEFGG